MSQLTLPSSTRPTAPLAPERLFAQPAATRPLLYIDLACISDTYTTFRQALPMATVHYAMKCNPHPQVLEHIKALGGSFEIASYNELALLQKIGVNPAEVLYSNPVKSPRDIRRAYAAGLRCFAFQSEDELQKFAALKKSDIKVYLRLTTPLGKSTVASEAKFGQPATSEDEQKHAVSLMEQARGAGLEPYGLAFHVGSQMEDPEAWTESLRNTGTLMELLQQSGIHITMLDIGGGFPAYHSANIPPLSVFGKAISRELAKLPYQPAKVAIEPGRALVSDAGALVAEVYGKALRNGQWWLYLSVGAFNGLMEALESGTELQYPMVDSRGSAEQASYVITGPSCDSQDTISMSQLLSSDIQTGDRVIIYTTGAYTTAYASGFNGMPTPRVICS
ncbi:MAG TPA: type III PLP-dependent enzyme [Candidatus Saccharimonadales bacterium]|nr:type III PLP-dependent enzyme [Candidatus Saccharimonadales bacterium]